MNFTEFAQGTVVTISVCGNGNEMSLDSEIFMALGEKIALITALTYEGKTLKLNTKGISCTLFIQRSENELPICFEDVVIDLVRYKGQQYHRVSAPAEGRPLNRRESFRAYVGLRGKMTDEHTLSVYDVIIKDVGLTGFAFVTSEDLNLQGAIKINFKDEQFKVQLRGTLVRKELAQNKFIYGCKVNKTPSALGKYIAFKQMQK